MIKQALCHVVSTDKRRQAPLHGARLLAQNLLGFDSYNRTIQPGGTLIRWCAQGLRLGDQGIRSMFQDR